MTFRYCLARSLFSCLSLAALVVWLLVLSGVNR